ncbi:hypothetical protein FA358_06345 [Pseudomonas aeruginosa]|nr:hypothetical protein [Pseudomonas aeruginosa]
MKTAGGGRDRRPPAARAGARRHRGRGRHPVRGRRARFAGRTESRCQGHCERLSKRRASHRQVARPVNCGARACGMSGFLPKARAQGGVFRRRYRSVSSSPASSAMPGIPPGCRSR